MNDAFGRMAPCLLSKIAVRHRSQSNTLNFLAFTARSAALTALDESVLVYPNNYSVVRQRQGSAFGNVPI
jgi:hypothetical protein